MNLQFTLGVLTIFLITSSLSALSETGQAELTIPVLRQRFYTGTALVISSALANISCADLGINGVLEKLNATLGKSKSYTLRSRILSLLGIVQLQSILVHDRITQQNVPPRRVWDLRANRVVPYWVSEYQKICGISHAWVDQKDRVNVMSPINGYE